MSAQLVGRAKEKIVGDCKSTDPAYSFDEPTTKSIVFHNRVVYMASVVWPSGSLCYAHFLADGSVAGSTESPGSDGGISATRDGNGAGWQQYGI